MAEIPSIATESSMPIFSINAISAAPFAPPSFPAASSRGLHRAPAGISSIASGWRSSVSVPPSGIRRMSEAASRGFLRSRSRAFGSMRVERASASCTGMPVSDCGAELSPSRLQKGALASSTSPAAFSIITATGEASANASRRASERFSACSVSRSGPMSCSTATTPAALSRASSAGWKAICTQRAPRSRVSSSASTKAEAALPSPTRATFCRMRRRSVSAKSEPRSRLVSVTSSRPTSWAKALFAYVITPFASAMATATLSVSTMRLKSSLAMVF